MVKNQFLKKFVLVYFAMIASMSLFGIVVYFLCKNGMAGEADPKFIKLLNTVLAFTVPLFLIAGHLLSQQVIKRIDPKLEFEQKLSKYGTSILIRCSFLEVPGLLISITALLTGQASFLLLLPLVIITFIVMRPKIESISTDLNLSPQEKEALKIQ